MKLMKFAAACAAMAVMAMTSSVQAQNVELIVDGDFEGTIGVLDETASGQFNPFQGGGVSAIETTNPFDTANHAALLFTGAENGFTGFQYQIDGITPGASYTLSLNAATGGAASLEGVNGEFRIEYLDVNGGFAVDQFANNASLDSVTDTYAFFTQTNTAPATATSLRAVIATQSFGAGADGSNSNTGTLFFDAVSIQGPAIAPSVPEPGSLALLGLAAFGMATRRRRS